MTHEPNETSRSTSRMSQIAQDQYILKYYAEQCQGATARGRSWDYCNRFFREHWRDLESVQDIAALHLGCFLASWGMYRGSSFLSQRAYTVHEPVIEVLASPKFSELWQRDIGSDDEDIALAGTIKEVVDQVDAAYRKIDIEYKEITGKNPQDSMDTVVTKVLLGTVGCLPARDSLFEQGFKHAKPWPYTNGSRNCRFVKNTLNFCIDNRQQLAKLQSEIVDLWGRPYPLMKLVDMHFWQIGASSETIDC